MSDLYNRIESCCKEKGVSITAMCKDANVSRGSLTDLKSGRSKTLSSDALSKIADYFAVSMDYLLGNNETALENIETVYDDASLKFALFGDADVDDEVLDDVLRYAKIARQMREEKNKE